MSKTQEREIGKKVHLAVLLLASSTSGQQLTTDHYLGPIQYTNENDKTQILTHKSKPNQKVKAKKHTSKRCRQVQLAVYY